MTSVASLTPIVIMHKSMSLLLNRFRNPLERTVQNTLSVIVYRLVVQEQMCMLLEQVFGSKGMLISENQRPTELTSHLKTGTSQDRIKFSFPQRYADSYVLAMKHFLNVVQGRAITISMQSLNVCLYF